MKRRVVAGLCTLIITLATGCENSSGIGKQRTSQLNDSQSSTLTETAIEKNNITNTETTITEKVKTKETTSKATMTTTTTTVTTTAKVTVTTANNTTTTATTTVVTTLTTNKGIVTTSEIVNAITSVIQQSTGQNNAQSTSSTIAPQTPTTVTTTTQAPKVINNPTSGYKDLPSSIQQYVTKCQKDYPGVHIGCGIFSLDGKSGFMYNPDEEIYSACTIKAPYAMYVLTECQNQGIDITQTKLLYTQDMYNSGSGVIKNGPVNTYYTIDYLLEVLLRISDNTAYNILASRFGMSKYQQFLNQFGGQHLYGSMYGRASARQRMNEWAEIVKYINSDAQYAQVLKDDLTGVRKLNPNTGKMEVDPNKSQYCYLVEWMKHDHEYLHKSGWSWGDYMSACDCAVIDNQYIIIIMTADYATGLSRTDILRGFGYCVEEYVDSVGGPSNLFS